MKGFIMSNVSFLKKWFIVVCMLLTFEFIGCSPSDFSARGEANLQRHKKYNADSLAKNGEEVGVLPDGRKVIRYSVFLCYSSEVAIYYHSYTSLVRWVIRISKSEVYGSTWNI